jgi:hypothetical protein
VIGISGDDIVNSMGRSGGRNMFGWDDLAVSGVGFLSGLFGGGAKAKQEEKNRQTQLEIAQMDDRRARELALLEAALKESQLNPFRQQLSQATSVRDLDYLERGRYTPTKMTVPAAMQGFMPQMSGGFSYTPDPAVLKGYGDLKRDVMSGHTAPTMTDPSNYGKTATLDLLSGATGVGPVPLGGRRRAVSMADLESHPNLGKRRRENLDWLQRATEY